MTTESCRYSGLYITQSSQGAVGIPAHCRHSLQAPLMTPNLHRHHPPRRHLTMKSIPATNTSRLAVEICNRPYRASLPKSLPDHWIRPIARDLRQIEQLMFGTCIADPPMAGPLMLAMHLMSGRMEERGMQPRVAFPEEARAAQWFRLYQLFVERELVTRMVGVPCIDDEKPSSQRSTTRSTRFAATASDGRRETWIRSKLLGPAVTKAPVRTPTK